MTKRPDSGYRKLRSDNMDLKLKQVSTDRLWLCSCLWALTAVSKQKWEADYDTVSSTKGKEAKGLREAEITTWGKTKAEVTRYTRFPLRLNSASPSSLDLDAVTQLHIVNSPISLHTLIWSHNWVFCVSSWIIWVMGELGGRWRQALYACLSFPTFPSSNLGHAPSAAHSGSLIHLLAASSSHRTRPARQRSTPPRLHGTINLFICVRSADAAWICPSMTQQNEY